MDRNPDRPDRHLEEFHRLLHLADARREVGDQEGAFDAAQAAMEALPADGTLDREEHAEWQLVAWLKRTHAQEAWMRSLQSAPAGEPAPNHRDLPVPDLGSTHAARAESVRAWARALRWRTIAVVVVFLTAAAFLFLAMTVVSFAPAGQRGALLAVTAAGVAMLLGVQWLAVWMFARPARRPFIAIAGQARAVHAPRSRP
ncbi:hypothetical protein ACFYN0_00795 [Streptomyces sp. NPDC006704]|uniref:hypothetical protein n=1 Tax=Streptomyces sp. NPDC006704 TaxID=3364760 RepID=UPI00367A877F